MMRRIERVGYRVCACAAVMTAELLAKEMKWRRLMSRFFSVELLLTYMTDSIEA